MLLFSQTKDTLLDSIGSLLSATSPRYEGGGDMGVPTSVRGASGCFAIVKRGRLIELALSHRS